MQAPVLCTLAGDLKCFDFQKAPCSLAYLFLFQDHLINITHPCTPWCGPESHFPRFTAILLLGHDPGTLQKFGLTVINHKRQRLEPPRECSYSTSVDPGWGSSAGLSSHVPLPSPVPVNKALADCRGSGEQEWG